MLTPFGSVADKVALREMNSRAEFLNSVQGITGRSMKRAGTLLRRIDALAKASSLSCEYYREEWYWRASRGWGSGLVRLRVRCQRAYKKGRNKN